MVSLLPPRLESALIAPFQRRFLPMFQPSRTQLVGCLLLLALLLGLLLIRYLHLVRWSS